MEITDPSVFLSPSATIARGMASCALAMLCTRCYLTWAIRHQVLDRPSARSSHTAPTPRGGGTAIVAVVLANLLGLLWLHGSGGGGIAVVTTLGAGLALLSWLDDLRGLSALLRLAVQVAIAAGVVVSLPLPAGALGYAVAGAGVLWIVALINIYNFMDGIDGLAAGHAMVVGLAWSAAAAHEKAAASGWLALALAAGSLGFLRYNWAPARLFMGDVGSAFIGFMVAVLPFLSETGAVQPRLLVFAAAVSWPFLFDASATLLRRALNRENLLQAHRSHYYQRLTTAGSSHRQTALMYIGWTASCGLAGLWYLAGLPFAPALLGLATLVPAGALVARFRHHGDPDSPASN